MSTGVFAVTEVIITCCAIYTAVVPEIVQLLVSIIFNMYELEVL